MNNQLISTFGEWVKHRRKLLDLSRAQLAQQVGCSAVAIKKIEANERRPSRQVAMILARELLLPDEYRENFVRVARGEISLERLPLPGSRIYFPEHLNQGMAISPASLPPLPLPATALIDREEELEEIFRLLEDPQCRLLTITGMAGAGKTRLAIEVASILQKAFAGGVYFVSLVGVEAPTLLYPTIANALGIPCQGSEDAKLNLIDALSRKPVLLVLDSFEHLIPDADLMIELLQQLPELKLLTTSREQLHLQAEWLFEVRGFPAPDLIRPDTIETSSAVRMFIQCARQVQPGYQICSGDADGLARICHLVQGLPLAIELAAHWTRSLSCDEIAQEIERGLDFLSTSKRDMDNRHRSIRSAFDYSWQMLSEDEQLAVKRLSVFRGGFQRHAAEQVAEASLSVLAALIDKSILSHSEQNRYEIHELVRRDLAARLAEDSADEKVVLHRHSHYYLALLRSRGAGLHGKRQKEMLSELNAEMENLRLAWNTATENEAIDQLCAAAEPLHDFLELRKDSNGSGTLFRRAADVIRGRLVALEGRMPGKERKRLEVTLANLLSYAG